MKKEIIELERLVNHRKGYGLMRDLTWNENDVLNKIVEWSQGKNVLIYKHLVRIEEEDAEGITIGSFGPIGGPYKEEAYPTCHRVKYLDIFYQERI